MFDMTVWLAKLDKLPEVNLEELALTFEATKAVWFEARVLFDSMDARAKVVELLETFAETLLLTAVLAKIYGSADTLVATEEFVEAVALAKAVAFENEETLAATVELLKAEAFALIDTLAKAVAFPATETFAKEVAFAAIVAFPKIVALADAVLFEFATISSLI